MPIAAAMVRNLLMPLQQSLYRSFNLSPIQLALSLVFAAGRVRESRSLPNFRT